MRETRKEYMRKYMKQYYQKYKEEKKEYRRKYYQTHKEQCKEIRKRYYQKHREYIIRKAKEYCEAHKEQLKETRIKSLQKLRNRIIKKHGNKCSNPNCAVIGGMKDPRCLQIDHVHGGGNKEIGTIGNSFKFLNKVLADTEGNYQLLCANCNWIKKYKNRENKSV